MNREERERQGIPRKRPKRPKEEKQPLTAEGLVEFMQRPDIQATIRRWIDALNRPSPLLRLLRRE